MGSVRVDAVKSVSGLAGEIELVLSLPDAGLPQDLIPWRRVFNQAAVSQGWKST